MGMLEVSAPLREIPVNPGVFGVMGDLECGLLWLPLMSIALNERYYNCLNMGRLVFHLLIWELYDDGLSTPPPLKACIERN